jgi:hypothetical protein
MGGSFVVTIRSPPAHIITLVNPSTLSTIFNEHPLIVIFFSHPPSPSASSLLFSHPHTRRLPIAFTLHSSFPLLIHTVPGPPVSSKLIPYLRKQLVTMELELQKRLQQQQQQQQHQQQHQQQQPQYQHQQQQQQQQQQNYDSQNQNYKSPMNDSTDSVDQLVFSKRPKSLHYLAPDPFDMHESKSTNNSNSNNNINSSIDTNINSNSNSKVISRSAGSARERPPSSTSDSYTSPQARRGSSAEVAISETTMTATTTPIISSSASVASGGSSEDGSSRPGRRPRPEFADPFEALNPKEPARSSVYSQRTIAGSN